MATFNVALDGSSDFSMLGGNYDWNGTSYFSASAGTAAGSNTVNVNWAGDFFTHGMNLYNEAPNVLNVNLTDAADGFDRYVGQFRVFSGNLTADLTNTGLETLMTFRDSNHDISLGLYSDFIRLRTGENNTTSIVLGDGGAGQVRMESGTNSLMTGNGGVYSVLMGRYGESGTNTVTTGNGNVSFLEQSGDRHTVTVGDGKLRDLKINDDGTHADITATNGGRIDVLRSYVTTETNVTTSNWLGLYQGGDGNDNLNLSGGAGMIDAGNGRNTINVTAGNVNTYEGGDGADIITITGTGRIKQLDANGGNNRSTTGSENMVSIATFWGDDWIKTNDGWVGSIQTDSGDDTVIIGAGGSQRVSTFTGVDTVRTSTAWVNNIETGGDQDFVTIGSGGARSIGLGEGNDRVYAYQGNISFIEAWDGNDLIYMGDNWLSRIHFSAGDDYLRVRKTNEDGGAGMSGGDGIDTIDFRSTKQGITVTLNEVGKWQNIGADDPFTYDASVIGYFSITSTERLVGTAFDDKLTGSDPVGTFDGANRLLGLGGNDELLGLGGDDDLRGGSGNDSINGGEGRDRIEGNRGDDFINGGTGNDNLFGGTGNDFFIFEDVTDMGFDRIKDFANGFDQINLSDFGFATFGDVSALASNAGSGDMRIDLGVGTIYIEGFTTSDFDASDVIL